MIDEIRRAISPLLPLRRETVEYDELWVTVAGPNWSLSVACPWRLMREGRLLVSYGYPGALEVVEESLRGEVVALGPDDCSRSPGDLRLALSDGTVLDVFPDTDLDPWVLRLPDHTFVGTASSA